MATHAVPAPAHAAPRPRIGVNQYWIKLAMAALMVLDHLHHVPGLVSPEWVDAFHVITRCVGVWFAYGAVEGVLYTSNMRKYLTRLWVAAAVMAAGSFALGQLLATRDVHMYDNNIFLTLAVGTTLLALVKRGAGAAWHTGAVVGALAGSVVAAMFLPIEGGLPVLPFMVITYALYRRVVWRDLAYLVLAAAMFALAWQPYDTWQATVSMLAENSDFMLVLVIPVLHLYNGEHGPHTRFSKYFFYVFYPAHLWLLALVAYFQAA